MFRLVKLKIKINESYSAWKEKKLYIQQISSIS